MTTKVDSSPVAYTIPKEAENPLSEEHQKISDQFLYKKPSISTPKELKSYIEWHNRRKITQEQQKKETIDSEKIYKEKPFSLVVENNKIKSLGRGSFGQVVEGYDKDGNGLAFKVPLGTNEIAYQDIQHEAEILEYLQNQGAFFPVSIKAHFSHLQHQCLAIELIKDKNLHFSKRKLSVEDFKNIAYQGLLTLREFRRLKILHGDIKPLNLIYDRKRKKLTSIDFNGAEKVSDIGVCRPSYYTHTYHMSHSTIFLGSPLSYHIDAWSMGCTLFEIYTFEQLFEVYQRNENGGLILNELGKPILLDDWESYLLQQHVYINGPLKTEWLREGKHTIRFFNKDLSFRKFYKQFNQPHLSLEKKKEAFIHKRMKKACDRRGENWEEIKPFADLIANLVSYDPEDPSIAIKRIQQHLLHPRENTSTVNCRIRGIENQNLHCCVFGTKENFFGDYSIDRSNILSAMDPNNGIQPLTFPSNEKFFFMEIKDQNHHPIHRIVIDFSEVEKTPKTTDSLEICISKQNDQWNYQINFF